MVMARKRFALVGAGLFGEMHARAYTSHPEAELAVICDLNAARAKEVAEKYGVAKHCTDWREVLQDGSLDAVSIATPDFAHAEIAVALATAGKHLLVEKPLATTVADCERMVAAAKQSGVKVMVDYHNRWNPVFVEAYRRARAGELGRPRYLYYRVSNTTFVPLQMLSWADRSSVLWFLGSHATDMTCWLFGEWPCRVYSVSRREVLKGLGVDTPDFFATTFEFPSGAVAFIENVWLLPQTAPSVVDVKCELVGTKEALYINTSSHGALEIHGQQGLRYGDALGAPFVHGQYHGFQVESIRHFADCVTLDREPLVSGEDGLEVTRALCAAEESVASRQPVDIVR
jgi:predicted dehydrogenase